MSDRSSPSEIIAALAEEFAERCRRGERPAVSEYAERHPELADEIREALAAAAMAENLAPPSRDSLGDAGDDSAAAPAALRQLGDYRIIREAGRGGMGVVYEAEQMSLGRHVALKVLPRSVLPDRKYVLRFQREARTAAKLHHTNIVPVFGVGEHEGLQYYVMQFIQGMPLNQVIAELKRIRALPGRTGKALPADRQLAASRRDGFPLPDHAIADVARSLMTISYVHTDEGDPAGDDGDEVALDATLGGLPTAGDSLSPRSGSAEDSPSPSASTSSRNASGGYSHPEKLTYWHSVANIGREVADALQHAHDQGILHRDIKPSNLLMDVHGTPWITDFGLAKASDQQDITHTGDTPGTLRYMPPEAFEGKTDARSDVYALGLTLYELLAFQPAFRERDRRRLIKQVTSEAAPRLDDLNPAIPRDLVTIVHKAIDPEPRHRYQTAQELADDLQRFLFDEPIRARPVSMAERAVRWSRRNKGLAASLSAIAVLLLTAFVASVIAAAHFRRLELQQRATAQDMARIAAEKGRLAEEKAALAEFNKQTSEEALENLYRALLREVEAVRLSRRPGYRDQAWSSIRAAAALAVENRDLVQLRREAVACLGDGYGRLPAVLDRFAGPVVRAEVSPDDAELGVTLQDGDVRVFDLRAAKELGRAKLPAAAADRPWLRGPPRRGFPQNVQIVRADDRAQESPPAASGKLRIEVDGNVRAFVVGSDGRHLALNVKARPTIAGAEEIPELHLWDLQRGERVGVARPQLHYIYSVRFSPDNRFIACACMEGVAIYQTRSMQQVGVVPGRMAVDVAWMPDSDRLAIPSRQEGNIHLWSLSRQRDLAIFAPTDTSARLAGIRFSHDGSRLVAFSSQSVYVWDLSDTAERRVLRGHRRAVTGMQFTPDGRWLLTACKDGLVRIWDTTSADPPMELDGRFGEVQCVAVSRDAALIAAGSYTGGQAVIWDRESGRELARFGEGIGQRVHRVAFNRDATLLAVGAVPGLKVLRIDRAGDSAGDEPALKLTPVSTPPPGDTTVGDLCFSHDGRTLAWATNEGQIRLWDLEAGVELKSPGPVFSRIQSLSFSPDDHLVFLNPLRDVVVWNTSQAVVVNKFSTTRNVAAAPGTYTIKTTLKHDGSCLAVSSESGRHVGLWRLEDGVRFLELPEQNSTVFWMCWSPDGGRLAVSRSDGTASIWDIQAVRDKLETLELAW